MRKKTDCILCIYKPLLRMCLLFGLYCCSFKCNHAKKIISIKPSKYSRILSIIFITTHLTGLILIPLYELDQTDIIKVLIHLNKILAGWTVILCYFLHTISHKKFSKWLEDTLKISSKCFKELYETSQELTKRCYTQVVFTIILLVVYVIVYELFEFYCVSDVSSILLTLTTIPSFYWMMGYYYNQFNLIVMVVESLYKNVEMVLSYRMERNYKMDVYLVKVAKLRRRVCYLTSKFNEYASEVIHLFIFFIIVGLLIAWSGFAEIIVNDKFRFDSCIVCYCMNMIAFGIFGTILTLLIEKLSTIEANFVLFLQNLRLTKLSSVELNKLEQFVLEVKTQPIITTCMVDIPISRRIIAYIFQYAFTYFLVYVQMHFIP